MARSRGMAWGVGTGAGSWLLPEGEPGVQDQFHIHPPTCSRKWLEAGSQFRTTTAADGGKEE